MTDHAWQVASEMIFRLREQDPARVFTLCGKCLAQLDGKGDTESLARRVYLLEERIAARKRMKEQKMERPQECRECHRAEPEVTFRTLRGNKINKCNACINKAQSLAAKARVAKSAKEESPAPPPVPAAPAVDVKRIYEEATSILSAAHEALLKSNMAPLGSLMVGIAASAARIQEMVRA